MLCKELCASCLKNLTNVDIHSEHEPRRIREDPVAFMLNIGLYYQGTVSNLLFKLYFI